MEARVLQPLSFRLREEVAHYTDLGLGARVSITTFSTAVDDDFGDDFGDDFADVISASCLF